MILLSGYGREISSTSLELWGKVSIGKIRALLLPIS